MTQNSLESCRPPNSELVATSLCLHGGTQWVIVLHSVILKAAYYVKNMIGDPQDDSMGGWWLGFKW